MFVIVETDQDWGSDHTYVTGAYGPFASEKEAKEYLKARKYRWGFEIMELKK